MTDYLLTEAGDALLTEAGDHIVVESAATGLIFSDGERTLQLITDSREGVWLAEFEPPLVAYENTYAEGADSEGRRKIKARPTNPEGKGKVYIGHTDEASFWDSVDELQELIASINERGGTARYRSPGNAFEVTYDIEAISLIEMPQRGVLLRKRLAEASFSFECLPYGRLNPVMVSLPSGGAITGPVGSFEVPSVNGHVPAWVELTLTDTSAQSRDLVEVGIEQEGYDPRSPASILIDSASLTTSGFAGSSVADAAAHGSAAIEALLTPAAVTVCSTGEQPHIGRKRIEARVKGSEAGVRVRLAWKVGDGPIRRERWRSIPGADAYYDVYLETIMIAEVPEGTHGFTAYVEATSEVGGETVRVDYVEVFPAEVWARVRASADVASSGAAVAYDYFADTSAGSLEGATADLGGTWARVAGDTDAATVDATNDWVQRATTADANVITGIPGIFYRLGTSAIAYTDARADHYLPSFVRSGLLGAGWFVRYVDPSNWLLFRRYFFAGGPATYAQYKLEKCVAGAVTELGIFTENQAEAWWSLRVIADTAGRVRCYKGTQTAGPITQIFDVTDSALATAGALDDGGYGFYDASSASDVYTRKHGPFTVSSTAAVIEDAAIFSGQSGMFTHEAYRRENSAGTRWGGLAIEGQHLRIPPATRAGRISRIAVKARRKDSEIQPDEGLTDTLTAELRITPRVLLIGG